MRRKTTEEFISDARKVHGEKFDYSKVEYINGKTKVCIVDKVYGDFWMIPSNHLKGQNHPEERRMKRKARLVHGIGINDSNERVRIGKRDIKPYLVWRSMIERCYSPRWLRLHPSYIGCTVCDDWKYFSRFKEWYDRNYVEGYELDKDLLSGNQKQYSPETCVFLPHELNASLAYNRRKNGLKIGAYKQGNGYRSLINVDGVTQKLGFYKTEDEAHTAYVLAKKQRIKEKAEFYYQRGEISQRIYQALLNYPVPEY